MENREKRHKMICEIIAKQKIANQYELQAKLAEMGINVTQATLSRDLTELHVIRQPDAEKGHIYALPQPVSNPFKYIDDNSPLNACRTLAFSGNLAVLKCLPSFAPSIALLLDGLEMEEILGTIAGDDTILIVLREGITHEQFRQSLFRRLPELRNRF